MVYSELKTEEIGRVKCMLHGCHAWESLGGRQCPHGKVDCSQTVHRCSRCGTWDYGEIEGPAYIECNNCHTNKGK